MKKLLDSLAQFNRREQTIMLVGALLLVLYIFWMLALAPLQKKRDRLLNSNVASEQSLGRVQLLVSQLQNLSQQSQAGAGDDNINGIINASLQENGLAMSSFTPSAGGEVRVRIDKASSEPLMQWLYDLETRHHIAIRELNIAASNDPGQVSVTLRLLKQ
ncbi:MAG TPA: type II secretion system protein M [Cellvibrio sp.]|nr:type II secretion system protein M [Cellvibrio sp.]